MFLPFNLKLHLDLMSICLLDFYIVGDAVVTGQNPRLLFMQEILIQFPVKFCFNLDYFPFTYQS